METKIILLCGLPATRKTTFGQWLEEEKGFLHLDVEKQIQKEPSKANLCRRFFFALNSTLLAPQFLQRLQELERPVVIDWGFPPEHIGSVEMFRDLGVTIWWFHGDREAARRAYIKRGLPEAKWFDIQMPKIEKSMESIEATFGSNMIDVLNSEGNYMTHEEIYERMF